MKQYPNMLPFVLVIVFTGSILAEPETKYRPAPCEQLQRKALISSDPLVYFDNSLIETNGYVSTIIFFSKHIKLFSSKSAAENALQPELGRKKIWLDISPNSIEREFDAIARSIYGWAGTEFNSSISTLTLYFESDAMPDLPQNIGPYKLVVKLVSKETAAQMRDKRHRTIFHTPEDGEK